MLKKIGFFIIVLSLVLLISYEVEAETTLEPLMSAEALARPYGMGGAFTAVSDDPSALVFNPAGLYQSGRVGFLASGGLVADDVFQYGKLAETIDNFF